jgi:hypothetical protein
MTARPWKSSRDIAAIYWRSTNDRSGIEVRGAPPHNRRMIFKTAALLLLRITVVIYNSEAIGGTELARAEAIAGRIFQKAGVEVIWRRATGADTSPGPSEIPLHIVAAHPANLTRDSNGFAVLMPEGSYAGISAADVRQTAESLDVDEPVLLAALIAHEIGHVLLGTREHSASGVMAPRFGSREILAARRGELRFLHSEARRIRDAVERRTTAIK